MNSVGWQVFLKLPLNNRNVFVISSMRSIKLWEAATRGVIWKKVFLEISQNSQENTCVRVSFLIKDFFNFIKKRFWHRGFPVNFPKFLRTPFYRTYLVDCFCMRIVVWICNFWEKCDEEFEEVKTVIHLVTVSISFIKSFNWLRYIISDENLVC